MNEIKIEKALCPYDCPSTCGLLARIRDGKIIGFTNDPEHPVSGRVTCKKMRQYERSIYAKDRILTPLKRTGPKGSGEFAPCSWEEAVATIAERWKSLIGEYGPETVLPCYYSGVMSDIQRKCGEAFFNRMGASALVQTLCSSAKGTGYKSVMGTTGCMDPRELKDSDFYLIWGSDLAATRIQTLADLTQWRSEDGRERRPMILIDTYANAGAKFCDETIVIRPGTDGALALAMMHVLVTEGLADEEWLREKGAGYEAFRETLPAYTPEWAEGETGIPAERIRQLARQYAAAKAPAIILGSGNSRHQNGGMTVRLIVLLSQFTGAWKRPGGGLCGCTPVGGSYVDLSRITRPDLRKKPGRRININQIAAVLALEGPEAVHSLYVYACNPVDTVSDQNGMIRGLLREDLFTVVHERFMTDTARYADIILPATFSVEQDDIYRCYGYCTLGVGKKLIDPPGECKSNWDTFRLLAEAMGYEDAYFHRSEKEMLEEILANPTAQVQALSEEDRAKLAAGGSVSMPFADHCDIKTPDGRFRFYDETCPIPLVRYVGPEELRTCNGGANAPILTEDHGGMNAEDYTLHLIAAPDAASVNSTFLDRADLMEWRTGKNRRTETDGSEGMGVLIHSETAASYGIADGDPVILFNELGEVSATAHTIREIARNAAVVRGVWNMAQAGGSTIEALTHGEISDIGEATTLNGNRIAIRPRK